MQISKTAFKHLKNFTKQNGRFVSSQKLSVFDKFFIDFRELLRKESSKRKYGEDRLNGFNKKQTFNLTCFQAKQNLSRRKTTSN